jgi:hypothetical protein
MALVHINQTVVTTPTPLVTIPSGGSYTAVQICNNHTSPIYLGDISVAATGATRGNQLASNASVQIWLQPNDTIWAISAANTAAGAISIVYSGTV